MYGDTTKHRQVGFSLIEILVTMVVLSIGLLGIAGLQASGLRNNHAAYTKTQATNLAMDMAERIRANPNGQTNYVDFDTSDTIPSEPDCISSGCTPTQLADYDKFEWSIPILGKNASVTDPTKPVLPAGRGIIQMDLNDVNNNNDDEFVITILWREIAYQYKNDDDEILNMAFNQCAGIDNQKADEACFEMRFKP